MSGSKILSTLSILAGLSSSISGCQDSAQISQAKAVEHVSELRALTEGDVEEVRTGLPQGADKLRALWAGKESVLEDPLETRRALERAREGVQLLRVAKSTFFAVTSKDGVVLRNDQDQDLMAGKSLFEPFPALKSAALGKYVETSGAMAVANGVAGRPDGQWVAATPIAGAVAGEVGGLYVTGWAWSSYAYRLEFALRSSIRSAIASAPGKTKEPLTYVFVIVGDAVYAAPQTPEVDSQAVAGLKPIEHLTGEQPFSTQLQVTDRDFGFAATKAPRLGDNVAIGVLRSET
jgi:hypothetical protein